MIFRTAQGPVRWAFGRDLMSRGRHAPTGDGDVHVRPGLDAGGRAIVLIDLHSPDGEARVQALTEDLESFLDETAAMVRPGTESEHLDVEAVIARLLAAASPDVAS